MPNTEIHDHHYDYSDALSSVVERLKSSRKYVDRLREARETAKSQTYATLSVEGHRYILHYHSSDATFELKPFSDKYNSKSSSSKSSSKDEEDEEELAKAA